MLVWNFDSRNLWIDLQSSEAKSFEIIQRLSKLSLATSWISLNLVFGLMGNGELRPVKDLYG